MSEIDDLSACDERCTGTCDFAVVGQQAHRFYRSDPCPGWICDGTGPAHRKPAPEVSVDHGSPGGDHSAEVTARVEGGRVFIESIKTVPAPDAPSVFDAIEIQAGLEARKVAERQAAEYIANLPDMTISVASPSPAAPASIPAPLGRPAEETAQVEKFREQGVAWRCPLGICAGPWCCHGSKPYAPPGVADAMKESTAEATRARLEAKIAVMTLDEQAAFIHRIDAFTNEAVAALEEERDALRAEVERLKKVRDEIEARLRDLFNPCVENEWARSRALHLLAHLDGQS